VHLGESQIKSLMTWVKKVEALIMYFVKDLEETVRERFYKWNTDQFMLVVDCASTKIKQGSL
jgi:hypothetical protein